MPIRFQSSIENTIFRSRFAAVTIASKAYLSLARVTACSFHEHHPEIPFYLLLTDEIDGFFDPQDEPFSEILTLGDIELDQLERFRFHYEQQELSYAATPYVLDFLLDSGFDCVLFLKQETLLLDTLAPLFKEMNWHSLALTPHFLVPPGCRNNIQWELNVLRAGVFNGGVIFVANRSDSREFLAWWKERMFFDCVLRVEEGYHYEQRWLDFAPSLVPGTHIIQDPGVNVGHWNLIDRDIRVANRKVTANGVPCRVFRFSGYEPEHPERISKWHPDVLIRETGDAAWIFDRYHQMLINAQYLETKDWPYAYGEYDNGAKVSAEHKQIYRRLGDRVQEFRDPMVTGVDGSFWTWLKSHPVEGQDLP